MTGVVPSSITPAQQHAAHLQRQYQERSRGSSRNKLYEPWANIAGYRPITETIGPGMRYACGDATVDQAHQQQADRAQRFATLPRYRKYAQAEKRTAHALQQQAGAEPAPAASLPAQARAT